MYLSIGYRFRDVNAVGGRFKTEATELIGTGGHRAAREYLADLRDAGGIRKKGTSKRSIFGRISSKE
jgi:hypothetical protein